MVTEQYCSYEIAKLLKEKGFDGRSNHYYVDGAYRIERGLNTIGWNEFDGYFTAPTHQMAMAWLREEHEIDIIPVIRHSLKYAQESPFRDYACRVYDSDGNIVMSATKWYSNYNNAIEAVLKYVLENLI